MQNNNSNLDFFLFDKQTFYFDEAITIIAMRERKILK